MITKTKVETFLYPTEDRQKVERTMRFVIGERRIREEAMEAFHGAKIIKLSAEFTSKRPFKEIIEKMDDEDKNFLLKTWESRIDNEGHFYIRISKQAAFEGKAKLVDKGDVIKIRISFVSFPFDIEKIKGEIKEVLERFIKGLDVKN